MTKYDVSISLGDEEIRTTGSMKRGSFAIVKHPQETTLHIGDVVFRPNTGETFECMDGSGWFVDSNVEVTPLRKGESFTVTAK